MFSERLLTAFMRMANPRYLSLEAFDAPTLPGPEEDKEYLLYVHVPFCQVLCPYCSFNRFPYAEDRARPYFVRLRDEMRLVAALGYDFVSMYVGGGTPTILVDELAETIDLARELFSVREVSSETNPNHLMPEFVEPLVERVQRLSVGVQSFDDGLLRRMDRYDKYGSGAEILERLRAVQGRFHSLNVDMIFNFPSQTEEMLRRDIELLNATGTNQTTFYPLMASPVVRRTLARSVGRVSYSREARYYDIVSEGLADAFEPSSAWTFSRIGGGMIDEYVVEYEEYVGIGSGAFSYLDGAVYVNTFSLREYERMLASGRVSVASFQRYDKRERMRYRFLMSLFGLRLDKRAFQRDFGVTVERGLPMEMAYMRAVGAFERDDDEMLTLTEKGRYLLVAMMREFFVGVNSLRDHARAALPLDERRLIFGDGDGGDGECPSGGGHGLAEEDAGVPNVRQGAGRAAGLLRPGRKL